MTVVLGIMRDVGCHIGVIIVDYRRVDINELRAFETNLLGGGMYLSYGVT